MKQPKSIIKLSPPPVSEAALDVTGKGARPDSDIKPIQIKVSVARHKEMKAYAAEQGISMKDMLLEGYRMLRETRGG